MYAMRTEKFFKFVVSILQKESRLCNVKQISNKLYNYSSFLLIHIHFNKN